MNRLKTTTIAMLSLAAAMMASSTAGAASWEEVTESVVLPHFVFSLPASSTLVHHLAVKVTYRNNTGNTRTANTICSIQLSQTTPALACVGLSPIEITPRMYALNDQMVDLRVPLLGIEAWEQRTGNTFLDMDPDQNTSITNRVSWKKVKTGWLSSSFFCVIDDDDRAQCTEACKPGEGVAYLAGGMSGGMEGTSSAGVLICRVTCECSNGYKHTTSKVPSGEAGK